VLFETEADTLKLAVEAAVKAGVSLNGADLHGADFSGADLCGADFSGADLCGVNFYSANLRGVNLSGADFHGASLDYASFRDVKFHEADSENACGSEMNVNAMGIEHTIVHHQWMAPGVVQMEHRLDVDSQGNIWWMSRRRNNGMWREMAGLDCDGKPLVGKGFPADWPIPTADGCVFAVATEHRKDG